jgi:hypothetical protein
MKRMKRRPFPVLLAAALASAFALAGCSSTQAKGYLNPSYDLARVDRVAVVDGNNPTFAATTRQQLVDAFEFEFLQRGWNPVERGNIQSVLDELDFQGKDFTGPDERKQLGHILNVPALAIVNIGAVGKEVAITVKLVDAETGEIIWMGDGSGSVNTGLSTMTGALVGVGVGAAIGHNSGGHAGVGGVIGGVAGGTAGNALSDSQVEHARKVVTAMCETLPQRDAVASTAPQP